MKRLLIIFTLTSSISFSQQPVNWVTTGNSSFSSGSPSIGTNVALPFRIVTNSVHRASFTWDGTEYADGSGPTANGLRIFNHTTPTNPIGVLDLLTSSNNRTHVGFGRNGTITGAGTGNRMEYYAHGDGFWFNAMDANSRAIWTRAGVENARMGINGYWHFGLTAADAVRRVEIQDANQQLRLTNGAGYAEFFAKTNGKLLITPSGVNTGFTNAGNTGYDPSERIDVDGTGRFRIVPTTTTPNCLIVGTNNLVDGDITLKRLNFNGNSSQVLLGNGTWGTVGTLSSASNGCWVNASNQVEWGTNALTHFTTIPMAGNNVLFSIPANTSSSYTVGGSTASSTARFQIENDYFLNGLLVQSLTSSMVTQKYGIYSKANNASRLHAIYGFAETGDQVYGVVGNGREGNYNTIGVSGKAYSSIEDSHNYGGSFTADGPSITENIGTYGYADGAVKSNFGGYFKAGGSGTLSIGVYGEATQPTGGVAFAGYFAGTVVTTQAPIVISDQQFKTEVTPITDALDLINKFNPTSYYMDTQNNPEFHFGAEKQYGFIAQEVEVFLPELVHSVTSPAQYDEDGNETAPSINFKSLNYNNIIPINTQAIIELDRKVEGTTLSDQSIKTNIQDLTGSLDKVLDMRGVSYDWNQTVHPELALDDQNHVGFIAQEIAQIDPRLTYLTNDNLLHVEYDKVVPILAEAIQELNTEVENKDAIIEAQQATIDDLNSRLSNLENCLSGILPFLCQLSQTAIEANTPAEQETVRQNLNVTLSNRTAIVLDQNVPNPFAEQTVINFSIPATVIKAQIHFYDGNGKLIQSVDVTERGLGSLNVFGADLSKGVYTYTLVADGTIVATKKMVKE